MVACIPAVATVVIIYMLFGASLTDFRPVASDEIAYWHQTFTFIHAGLNGGYYTFKETPAALSIFRFGPHGPAFPILYGLIGRWIGWEPYSAVLINMILATVALGVYIRCVSRNHSQLLALALLMASFWPLLLLLPTNLQEGLHYAIAITLAGLISRLKFFPSKSPWPEWVIVLAFIGCSSLIRPTWSLLWIPLAFLATLGQPTHRVAIAVSIAMLSVVFMVLIFGLISAPAPSSYISGLAYTGITAPLDAIQLLWQHVVTNMRYLASSTPPQSSDDWLVLTQRAEVLFVLGASCLLVVRAVRRHRQREDWPGDNGDSTHIILLSGLNLGMLLLAQFLFYDMYGWRDYRVVSPHLLTSVLLLLANPALRRWVAPIVVANLLTIQPFLDTNRAIRLPNFRDDRLAREEFRAAVASVIAYDAQAPGWCNTLLAFVYFPQLTEIPGGIGLSVPFAMSDEPRSKYLLLGPAEDQQIAARWDVQLLVSTPLGHVYRNLSADC